MSNERTQPTPDHYWDILTMSWKLPLRDHGGKAYVTTGTSTTPVKASTAYPEWQPISTLPMDRKVMVLFQDPADGEQLTMFYDGRTTDICTWVEVATHWIFIPDYPTPPKIKSPQS